MHTCLLDKWEYGFAKRAILVRAWLQRAAVTWRQPRTLLIASIIFKMASCKVIKKIFKYPKKNADEDPLLQEVVDVDFEIILKTGKFEPNGLTKDEIKRAKMVLKPEDFKKLESIALNQTLRDVNFV